MNNQSSHYIASVITYHGPTDTKGSRVKIFLPRFQKGKIIPFDHSFNNSTDIAKDYLSRHGIQVKGECELGNAECLLIEWNYIEKLESLFSF